MKKILIGILIAAAVIAAVPYVYFFVTSWIL